MESFFESIKRVKISPKDKLEIKTRSDKFGEHVTVRISEPNNLEVLEIELSKEQYVLAFLEDNQLARLSKQLTEESINHPITEVGA